AAGPWRGVYPSTDAMLFPPGGEGYDIARGDAGLRTLLEGGPGDAAEEREAIGVDEGAQVGALYDTTVPFASAVYSALRTGVAEAGWEVRDCGSDDVSTAIEEDTRWQAIITRVPIPQTPAQISRQWGSEGRDNLSVTQNADRDALSEELARAADQYEARERRGQIEASIVEGAV